jgi:pimeloyl-ACP methyl ester carboxylesterase
VKDSGASVDTAYLETLRRFADPRLGIEETFLTPELGGGRTVAVLSRPLGEAKPTGWVICHSFAFEQINIQPLETLLARRLASAGFPVLRYHGQGYGDSALPVDRTGLASHLRDARDAVDLLREAGAVSQVGLAGARLGGAVAAAVGADVGATGLVLWEPVTRGRLYIDGMVQQRILADLTAPGRESQPGDDPLAALREHGVADLQGFQLTLQAHEEIRGLELVERARGSVADALVVQVARAARPRPDLARLIDALGEKGGTVTLESIPPPPNERPLGAPRFRGNGDGTKTDTQSTLERELLSRTMEWVDRWAGARSNG